jgi:hemerythrin-like domain-containing protein
MKGERLMEPRGHLMIEHRLILNMISLIEEEARRIERSNAVDRAFIDMAVDFMRTYADQTHHGKEEEILFRELSKKKLSDFDRRIMNELIQEHVVGRTTTVELVKAAAAYQSGSKTALSAVTTHMNKFADFYPRHIEKEDQTFFPSAMAYFSESEQQSILAEFREFDCTMIHSKYKAVVESLTR